MAGRRRTHTHTHTRPAVIQVERRRAALAHGCWRTSATMGSRTGSLAGAGRGLGQRGLGTANGRGLHSIGRGVHGARLGAARRRGGAVVGAQLAAVASRWARQARRSGRLLGRGSGGKGSEGWGESGGEGAMSVCPRCCSSRAAWWRGCRRGHAPTMNRFDQLRTPPRGG